jgi:hypothetical protein
MRLRNFILALGAVLSLLSAGYAQRGRMFFEEEENSPAPIPADASEKTEFVFARLRYPSFRGGSMSWSMRGNWTVDWPKADRQFVQGVRRLSRVHVRSVEQVVDLESDDIFNYPWVYVVEPGHWDLPDHQAKKLREYLLRGGFIMTDDFHGTFEWDIFMASMSRVFPEKPAVDIEEKDPIFHVLWDLNERVQVPGIIMFYTGRTYEYDGVDARWRAIYDDKGRILVAICQNMDLGDAWEWADHPRYPEHYASLAYRVGINYIIYSMTH